MRFLAKFLQPVAQSKQETEPLETLHPTMPDSPVGDATVMYLMTHQISATDSAWQATVESYPHRHQYHDQSVLSE